jgi:heme A synthase
LIEYTHRVTSGVLGPMVLGLVAWAWYGAGRRTSVRVSALLTLFFVALEAAIGAGLVLAELVKDDASTARAVVIALHLGNTLMLTASGALCAWFGAGRPWPKQRGALTAQLWLWVALGGVLLTCMSGAVTALGDTLFPVQRTFEHGAWVYLRGDSTPGAHFLVQLRILHPLVAVVTAAGVWYLLWPYWATGHEHAVLGRTAACLVALQVLLGALNVALGAPGWLQLLHLLLAQVLWITLVLLLYARASDWAGAAGQGA